MTFEQHVWRGVELILEGVVIILETAIPVVLSPFALISYVASRWK